MKIPSETLNFAQNEAVNYLRGPSLVLAGAGSGKTRVITYKIARLIQAGIPAEKIAAITFTNKAAIEMRERAKTLIANAAKDLMVCTFHSLGVRLLRQDGALLGLKPQFSIMDTDDVLGILRDIGATTDHKQARLWLWQISLWKNQGLTAQQALEQAEFETDRQIAKIMQHYQERLSAYQAVDFDDLIALPLKLLRDHPEARERWQNNFAHILVDEYQDTNASQYELLKLLVGTRARFTAVGDDDQSIYGWRGATLENLRLLSKDFPDLKVIKLEQNYRSTQAILNAANALISGNPKLFEKKLWSELGTGEAIKICACDHDEHEAQQAVSRIHALKAQHNCGWEDFAILYRTNHQARVLEQSLRRHNIPYRVSGGQSFFDRAEVRDLCAWLRLIVNHNDDPAFLRAITTPKRGIGHQTLAALGKLSSQYKISLFEALSSPSLSAVLSTRAIEGLQAFGRYILDLQTRTRDAIGHQACAAFFSSWLKEISYEEHLYHAQEHMGAARWQNVMDFCDWLSKRAGSYTNDLSAKTGEEKSLLEIAQTISLILSLKENHTEKLLTLSTLHAAKGLEWPHVILAGSNEGTLPMLDPEDKETLSSSRLEEERRLMYVGITRARQTLMVSYVKRKRQGQAGPACKWISTKPSRFIAEMQLENNEPVANPMEKIKALRAEFAARAANQQPTEK